MRDLFPQEKSWAFLVRPGLAPVGHRFGVLARFLSTFHRPDGACPHRTPLWRPRTRCALELCSPRPASGRGAGGSGGLKARSVLGRQSGVRRGRAPVGHKEAENEYFTRLNLK